MDISGKVQLSPEASALFQEGISLVLSRWSALQLAVENEAGGKNSRDKALRLVSDIFSWFTQTKEELLVDDLEDGLDEALSIYFNTDADDESPRQVANVLTTMNEQCINGNYEYVHKLRAASAQRAPVQHIKQASSEDEDEDEDEDGDGMMMDTSDSVSQSVPAQMVKNETEPQRPKEAEGGWETVSRKKGRVRRN